MLARVAGSVATLGGVMRRVRLGLRIAAGSVAAACALMGARDAAACGGCFHPPTQTVSDITDERMLLAVSTTQSTLYDQIQYSGSPASFAWVLPIKGTVTVGLSADVLFGSIDTLTATQINPPPQNCPGPPSNCNFYYGATANASGGRAASADAGAADSVIVTKQQIVGPYETVQLHATDSSALDNWLTTNGYLIPSDVVPVIAAYVSEGFDFLAMKLAPGAGVQAMRPVRVTTQGGSLSLPLRMASIGTGAIVGISIWVVSDGRYEPANFPFFHIEDSQLVWDWKTSSSNYTTLRANNEATLKNKGWEIESSIDVNQQVITNVIASGGQYYGNGLSGLPVSDATQDYLAVGDADAGADAGYQSAEEVRAADIAALFAGLSGSTVRITRMRSDISHAAMTNDFVLQASSDQSELSNVRNVVQAINLTCPIYGANCNIVGSGTPAQAAAANATVGGAGTGRTGGPGLMPGSTGSSQGCAASPATGAGRGTGAAAFGGLAGLVALLGWRGSRARRRRARGE
jgi:hypothetical protein